MKCPRDKHPLTFDGHGVHPRHECVTCGGLLLSDTHFMAALGHTKGTTLRRMSGVLELHRLPPGDLSCPRDNKPMRVIVHHGVEIDICPTCRSLWLDAGELEKIAAEGRKKRNKDKDRNEGDVDLHSGSDGSECTTDNWLDVDFDGVGEFLGEAVGSLLDGL